MISDIQRRLCRWRTSLLISIVLLYVKYNLANKISFDNKFFIVFVSVRVRSYSLKEVYRGRVSNLISQCHWQTSVTTLAEGKNPSTNEGLPGRVLVPLFPSKIALCSHVPTLSQNVFVL